jgi:hypothetical protein
MIRHLSDEQIQSYLDKQPNQNIQMIEEHLSACPSCMKSVQEYRQLYTSLETDPFPSLSTDFTERVVSRVSGSEESRWQFFESGFIITFFLFGIAAALYFVNPLPFLTNSINTLVVTISEFAAKFLPELNGNTPIFVVAVLIFLLVELVDKKLLRSRQ